MIGSPQRQAFLLIYLLFLMTNDQLESCTRIFWNNSLNTAAARTMDLHVNERPKWHCYTRGIQRRGCDDDSALAWTSKYGSVVLTAFDDQGVSEGMNEKGLAAHVLYMEGTNYEQHEGLPVLSNGLWVQYLLDNFATVDEAIKSFKTFQLVAFLIEGEMWPLHLCLEDASGDSAIVEYIDGKMALYHGSEHKVMTSDPAYYIHIEYLRRYEGFGGILPLLDDLHSEGRFVQSTVNLKALQEPKSISEAIEELFQVIDKVKIPYIANEKTGNNPWPTRWISITDNSQLVYYFYSTIVNRMVWVDLKKIDFPANLSNSAFNPHDPELFEEVFFCFNP